MSPFLLAVGVCFFVARVGFADVQEISPLRLSTSAVETSQSPAGTSVASGTHFRLRAYGAYYDADGDIRWGNRSPGLISDIDLKDVLGMDTDGFTGGILAGFDFGPQNRMHLDFSYDGYFDIAGDRVVGSISIDGEVYTGRVKSSLELHAGMANFGFDFLQLDRLTVTGNLGLRIFYIDTSIEEVASGRDASVRLLLPLPAPGIAARYDITDNIYIKGGVAGIYLGELGSYLEASAEVGYDINRNMGVFVGARYWAIDVDWDDNEVDVGIPSLYGGVEFRI